MFNHPPERGIDCRYDGNKEKKAKGIANAKAKPNIPTAGPTTDPVLAASTKRVPIIGPVQEKETSTNVNAIKKILTNSVVVSTFLSIALTHDEGNVISNKPKNDNANTIRRIKNRILNIALVAKLFSELAPIIPVTN